MESLRKYSCEIIDDGDMAAKYQKTEIAYRTYDKKYKKKRTRTRKPPRQSWD